MMCRERGLTVGLGNHAVRVPQQPVGGLRPGRRPRLVFPEALLQHHHPPVRLPCLAASQLNWLTVLTS